MELGDTGEQQVLADAMEHDRQAQVAPEDEAWLNGVMDAIEPRIGGDRPDWRAIAKKSGMTYDGFRKRFARLTG